MTSCAGRRSSEDVARIYVTLYWPLGFKDRFLSSGFNGDIIIWNLNPMEENDFEVMYITSVYFKCFPCIISTPETQILFSKS